MATRGLTQANYYYYVQLTDQSGDNRAHYRTHPTLYNMNTGIAHCELNNLQPSHSYLVTFYTNAGNGSSLTFTTPARSTNSQEQLEDEVKSKSGEVDRMFKENQRLNQDLGRLKELTSKPPTGGASQARAENQQLKEELDRLKITNKLLEDENHKLQDLRLKKN